MKSRKALSVVLMFALLSSSIIGGCTKKNSSDGKVSPATTVQAPKAPDEISIFMGTAGIKIPEGAKYDDNPYINKIAELANVKFKEIIVPEYADFQTKFNLMVSSGNIPDLVHCWFAADVQLQGKAGAFMDLSDVIAKSPVLSKRYSQSSINLMKDDSNKIYALRTVPGKDPQAAGVRMDLIDEVNGGKVPVTPDEWYDVFKKLKAKYPDSVPYSSNGGLDALQLFFKAYGVNIGRLGADWQYKDGKIISAFEAPLVKDSILYHKKLYTEGLLDKTFVTNKSADFLDRKWNKKDLLAPNNLASVIGYVSGYATNKVPGAVFVPCPLPKVNDPKVTDADVYTAYDLLGYHCVAVAASTKKKDAVVRLIETLGSTEVGELTAWGLKGVDFTEENGKKTATAKGAENLPTRKLYSFMFTYASAESVQVSVADNLAKIDPAAKDKYTTLLNNGMKTSYEQAEKVKPDPVKYIQLSTDTQSKVKEANELSKAIIIKAIIGEITMQEYDTQVSDYLKKYKFITDEYNTKLPAIEAKLK